MVVFAAFLAFFDFFPDITEDIHHVAIVKCHEWLLIGLYGRIFTHNADVLLRGRGNFPPDIAGLYLRKWLLFLDEGVQRLQIFFADICMNDVDDKQPRNDDENCRMCSSLTVKSTKLRLPIQLDFLQDILVECTIIPFQNNSSHI